MKCVLEQVRHMPHERFGLYNPYGALVRIEGIDIKVAQYVRRETVYEIMNIIDSCIDTVAEQVQAKL